MTVDESFKKPGAVPFKWEIRPGVPKTPYHPNSKHQQQSPPQVQEPLHNSRRSQPPPKLRPPPSGFQFFPPEEPRTRSFRSTPRTRSGRWAPDLPVDCGPECVVSSGCFPGTPLLKRKENISKKSSRRHRTRPEEDKDYMSDLETPSLWFFSTSTRKSLSPFRGSPSSTSSFPSLQSSPRLSLSSYLSMHKPSPQRMADHEWAGFGLF